MVGLTGGSWFCGAQGSLNEVARAVIEDKNLDWGLIRLYILHRAATEPVLGLGKVEELTLHGFKLSVVSICQALRGLERKRYLMSAIVPSASVSQQLSENAWRSACR